MSSQNDKRSVKIQAGRYYFSNAVRSAFWFQEAPETHKPWIGYSDELGERFFTADGESFQGTFALDFECDKDGNPIEQKDEQPASQPIERQTALPPSREQVWWEAFQMVEKTNITGYVSGKLKLIENRKGTAQEADWILSEYDKRFNKQEGK